MNIYVVSEAIILLYVI